MSGRSHSMLLLGGIILASLPAVGKAADAFQGQGLYAEHCQECHGRRGEGALPRVPDFSRGEGLMRPDAVIADFIRRGGSGCPGFSGILSARDVRDVISHLRSLER